MGAWGPTAFENDAAGDWGDRLVRAHDLAEVDRVFRVVEDETGYLEIDAACEALAACEVIARLQGRWGIRDPYTEVVDHWVLAHPQQPPSVLVQRAVTVIDRITGESSELAELSDENDDPAWRASVAELRARVIG